MAASCPDYKLALLLCLMLPAAQAAEHELLPQIRADIPIVIDANSSDFSYASGKLGFEGLTLVQGDLSIKADYAETEELNFDDGFWVFTGNVIFKTATAELHCDTAELTFFEHQLMLADTVGEPAWFEQETDEAGKINSGEAKTIIYQLAAGTLQMETEALFSDGNKTVSGDLITYDLQARHLRAGAGSSGPVKIVIEPPGRDKEANPQ